MERRKKEKEWLSLVIILSDALHFFNEGKRRDFQWIETHRESVDSEWSSPKPPLWLSYLGELMSDGLTRDHPWQIEMTLQTSPTGRSQKNTFHTPLDSLSSPDLLNVSWRSFTFTKCVHEVIIRDPSFVLWTDTKLQTSSLFARTCFQDKLLFLKHCTSLFCADLCWLSPPCASLSTCSLRKSAWFISWGWCNTPPCETLAGAALLPMLLLVAQWIAGPHTSRHPSVPWLIWERRQHWWWMTDG